MGTVTPTEPQPVTRRPWCSCTWRDGSGPHGHATVTHADYIAHLREVAGQKKTAA